jgi:hypothetical protein
MSSERRASHGFFPVVAGRNVRVERGGGVVFFALRRLFIERGGGQWLISGGDLHVHEGGGAALIARTAHVNHGRIGVLIARDVRLDDSTPVALRLTPPVAIVAAAAFAAGWWLNLRRH